VVSGDRIAWAASPDGKDYEIYTWTPSGGTVRLTNNTSEDTAPQISGDRIVWGGTKGSDGGTDWEIFTWSPSTGVVQLTKNALDDELARVSDDRVVWMEGNVATPTRFDIYTWTPAGGTVRVTNNTTDDVYPDVSGNRIVWTDDSQYVHTWTATGGSAQIDTGAGHVVEHAVVSGDRIAAASDSSGVYMWTPGGGSWVETGNLGGGLAISGDRVVWNAFAANVQQVFSWTPTEGVVQLSSGLAITYQPEVSGDRVVWLDAISDDAEIYTWTPSMGTLQVTSNTTDDVYPGVSGDRIVWLDLASSTNGEVYTAVAGPALPQFEDTDPHITYSPASSWAPQLLHLRLRQRLRARQRERLVGDGVLQRHPARLDRHEGHHHR
jgi:hypothetical protein